MKFYNTINKFILIIKKNFKNNIYFKIIYDCIILLFLLKII